LFFVARSFSTNESHVECNYFLYFDLGVTFGIESSIGSFEVAAGKRTGRTRGLKTICLQERDHLVV